MIFRKKEKLTALKLYSIGADQSGIHRPNLVDLLLDFFSSRFGELPSSFVIHGPYGIPKGQDIGIRAFKNKLKSKGHDKYYALHGETESKLGFEVLFEAKIGNDSYSELIIWFNPDLFSASLKDVAVKFQTCFSTSSGFDIEINPLKQTVTEDKINRTIFGGTSIEVSYENKQWIKGFKNGAFRKADGKNLYSDIQFKEVVKQEPTTTFQKLGNLNYVEFGA